MATGFDFDFDFLHADEAARDVDVDEFKRAVGSFATGVTVVTVGGADGARFGFTANSFTSVSLRPPLVLLCLDRRAPSLLGFRHNVAFAVNVLAADQEDVSRHFARRAEDKFAGIACSPGASGVPLIDGCLATIECRLEQSFYGGDHVILLGRVLEVASRDDGAPLVFHRSRYLAPPA